MDRREFVLFGLAGLGAVGGLAPAASAESGRSALQPPPTVLMRRNIYCLDPKGKEVTAYATAVKTMQARPVTDPTSWLAQANIHGAFSPPAGMIANACRHDTLFFLAWHRMYLHFFERITRAASGDSSFALPYWGYSPVGSRDLPAPFRVTTSPLFVSQRRATINSGGLLAASVVDSGPAMLETDFSDFTNVVNGTPHGVVHTGVGGPGGFMSAFETAGQDPIFWLHHANIDRLWEVWLGLGGGRVNPTGNSSWMTTPFEFYDEKGARVKMTGAQIVDTAKQLNYRYAAPTCLPKIDFRDWKIWTRLRPWDPRVFELVKRIQVRPPRPEPDPPPIARLAQALPLGSALADVRLPVSPEGRKKLVSFPTDEKGGNRLVLVLDEIKAEAPAEVYYEIYVNLATQASDTQYTSPHYVGNLDFFGPSPEGPHRTMPRTRAFNLMPVYARLQSLKRWRDEDIRVTFVPRSYVENEAPDKLLAKRTQATIGRVSVVIR